MAGRVDGPVAALLGGVVAGLVIGAGQALVSRRRLDPRRWIPATAIGMGIGLLLGAVAVGYRTSLADLALMGAITGLVLGVAQALALPRRTRCAGSGPPRMPLLWALGWTVTTLGGIGVDEQFTVFGAYGAVTFSALSGLLLHRLLRAHRTAARRPGPAPTPAGRRHDRPPARRSSGPAPSVWHLRRPAPPRRDRPAGQPLRPRPRARRRRGHRRRRPRPRLHHRRRPRRRASSTRSSTRPTRSGPQFPALQAGVLAAAEAAGARLVSMENVYLYGRPAGAR